MTLQEKLMEDMKQAMRAKDSVKLGVIRFLRSEIKNFEIDNGPQDDEGVLKIINRLVKQSSDAIEQFKDGNRMDLVDEETAKVEVLKSYLPAQMSDSELEKIVSDVVSTLEDKNMGAAMKAVMAKVAGQADGSRVSAMVKKYLG